ncbi:MAG: bifunctional hydroxymethylpyrimidine kinase/phosphomethylpyrimidine kinase [Leptospiraceae bacterium]|nr:bifunctional hydroxymethylpyrimidine kinase/phosphomethylpyrimidine kinase [Leptospiraceae bacterium]MCP5493684.1 bifunctional hydroxymethylpyrimidine kinase/phosphomethylpyrimidine kinase [Leptospiraceae bacterium]
MNYYPTALTIAGSDSGGGAGIQADLKAFSFHFVHGTSAITCITAQNPDGVSGILEIPIDLVEKQIQAVLDFFPVSSIKTGMLFSLSIINKVVETLKDKKLNLVVDPVMVATSGAKLLKNDAISAMLENLIPIASLVTPNKDEGEILLGKPIQDFDKMEDVTVEIYAKYKVPILLKGGHIPKENKLKDVLYDGHKISTFHSEYLPNVSTHGTGCTYSASIAALLAKGHNLENSVRLAKKYLHEAIQQSYSVGRVSSLNHSPGIGDF